MKSRLLLCAGFVLPLSVDGAVVLDSSVQLIPHSFFGEFELRVDEVEDRSDYTGIFFNFDGSTINNLDINADGGSDWYRVSQGEVFSSPNIVAGSFPIMVKVFDTGYEFNDQTVGPDNFFLGVTTGFSSEDPTGRNVFGWVELAIVGNELSLVRSAMAYDQGNGIIVGTARTIPEPSSVVLCALAVPGLYRRKRS